MTLVLVFHRVGPQVLQGELAIRVKEVLGGRREQCRVWALFPVGILSFSWCINNYSVCSFRPHLLFFFFQVCACPHSSFNHGETRGACGRSFIWPLLSIRTEWERFSMGNLTVLHMRAQSPTGVLGALAASCCCCSDDSFVASCVPWVVHHSHSRDAASQICCDWSTCVHIYSLLLYSEGRVLHCEDVNLLPEADQCSSALYAQSNRVQDISFHQFPSGIELVIKWLRNIWRLNSILNDKLASPSFAASISSPVTIFLSAESGNFYLVLCQPLLKGTQVTLRRVRERE